MLILPFNELLQLRSIVLLHDKAYAYTVSDNMRYARVFNCLIETLFSSQTNKRLRHLANGEPLFSLIGRQLNKQKQREHQPIVHRQYQIMHNWPIPTHHVRPSDQQINQSIKSVDLININNGLLAIFISQFDMEIIVPSLSTHAKGTCFNKTRNYYEQCGTKIQLVHFVNKIFLYIQCKTSTVL